jgi:hypothetical protein
MKALGVLILLMLFASHYGFAQIPNTDSSTEVNRTRQVSSQVDRLVGAIKDDYANEVTRGRAIRFVDVPGLGTLGLATFVIEGFAGGNNVHQYLAIFGPPDDRGTAPGWPYFALSAMTEIGDGCAVDVRRAHFSKVQLDFAVAVTLPAYVTGANG